MKSIFIAVMILIQSTTSFADHKKGHGKEHEKMPEMSPQQAEMMKKWKEYSTPSEGHQVLVKMAGKWKYTSKWWETTDGAPQESSGTSNLKLILGGRFLQNDTKGKAMGMPFEGLGLLGYDNILKKYTSIWLDNMGTGIMLGTGSYDAADQVLKDEGEMVCPMTKNKDHKAEFRTEWKLIDKKNMLFTMWAEDPIDGKVRKMMEMAFKR